MREVGPELLGHLELRVDVYGFLDIDRTIACLRRVVQLAQARVTGTGVVPGVGTLGGTRIHQLDDFKFEGRIKLFEQYGQGSTHDASAYQYRIDCFILRH